MASLKILTTLAFLTITTLINAQSGTGTTTRYWDCCKPSCAWKGKGQLGGGVVKTCSLSDQPLSDPDAKSGCEKGGTAFSCSSQSPWVVSDSLAYGFTSVSDSLGKCCTCFDLTFTSGPISGKKMIVQATNTGTDVKAGQFDLAMPGGGFGMFDACTRQWQATSAVWGEQYGGMKTNNCPKIPQALQPGCGFRWGWMKGADNPSVQYKVVPCPAALVAKSGCGSGSGAGETTGSNSTGSTGPGSTGPGSTGPGSTGSGTDYVGSDPVGSDTTGSDPVGSDPVGSAADNHAGSSRAAAGKSRATTSARAAAGAGSTPPPSQAGSPASGNHRAGNPASGKPSAGPGANECEL